MEQLERELHRIAHAARTEKERREASKLEWEQEKVVLQRRVVAAESAASSPHTVGRLDRSSRNAHHANGGGLESFLQVCELSQRHVLFRLFAQRNGREEPTTTKPILHG